MKKLLSILLSVCILLTAVSVSSLTFSAFAQETELAASGETEGDFEYTVSNGKATITKYTGSAAELEIPSTLGGYPVTRIDGLVFQDHTELTSVVIPDSVTSIGWSEYYGRSAFYGCTGLVSIKVAEGNPVLDSRNNCNAIIETKTNTLISGCMSTVIPDSVTSIGVQAFIRCTGLTSIIIPDSVTSIGGYAFYNCTSLTGIVIPYSMTSISYGAFFGCSGLASIKVAEGNSVYDSRNNCNAIIKTESNILLLGCKTTVIPGSVTSIGYRAFEGCTGLTSINIPDSVTWIDNEVFSGCAGLTSMQVSQGNSVYDSRNNCNAIINTASNTLIYGCKNTIIPDSVTEIGGGAFLRCTGLTSIVIPRSVWKIDGNPFSGCTGLESMKVSQDNSVYDSRNDCNAIIETASNTLISGCKNTVIPDSVTQIGGGAFSRCTGLTSIVIPDSVTSIGSVAFWGCSGLTSIAISESVTKIDYLAFVSCTGLTSIIIPDSVTEIGTYAVGFYFDDVIGIHRNVDGFIIYGHKGTEAQRYAEKNKVSFIDLSELPTDPPVIIGDADSDGEVTVVDAAQIQKSLVHFPVSSFNEQAANVDGDSAVTILDATYIQKWLAKIEVPYPIGEPAA